MQALCHEESHPGGAEDALESLAQEASAGASTLSYARTICRHVATDRADIDRRLRSVLERWDLDRIGAVERNVMRVATSELLQRDVPPSVAIDEAIEIAREFGAADSPGFVNGVLDALWTRLKQEL